MVNGCSPMALSAFYSRAVDTRGGKGGILLHLFIVIAAVVWHMKETLHSIAALVQTVGSFGCGGRVEREAIIALNSLAPSLLASFLEGDCVFCCRPSSLADGHCSCREQ
jgi:hypothetical protein